MITKPRILLILLLCFVLAWVIYNSKTGTAPFKTTSKIDNNFVRIVSKDGIIRRQISKQTVEKEPYRVWNTYVDLLGMEPEDKLTETQRIAQRAYLYDSEIQNGGHLQYFENQRKDGYSEVIQSLKLIGAEKHAVVLEKASALFLSKKRTPAENVEDFVKKAREGEYTKLNTEYHSIKPNILDFLEEYLKIHKDDFIEII